MVKGLFDGKKTLINRVTTQRDLRQCASFSSGEDTEAPVIYSQEEGGFHQKLKNNVHCS